VFVEAMAGLVAIEHAQLQKDASDERRRAFARIVRALAKPLLLRQLAVMRHRHATDADIARRAQAVLYRFGTDGAEALFDEYVSVPTAEARAVCLEALRAIRRTHDALFALVRDTRDLVVRQAAGLLGELGDPRGEQMLIELIRHPDARTRRAAVAALTRFSTPSAVDALGFALDDESPIVRARAVAALRSRGGPRAVALLAPLLDREEDREVLYATVAALGAIGGGEAVAALIPGARGETSHSRKRSATYRIAACTALVAIRSPQSMAAVQALREDRDRDVRDAAVRLVAQASRRTTAGRAVVTP
jgi:HEAT repeat protein